MALYIQTGPYEILYRFDIRDSGLHRLLRDFTFRLFLSGRVLNPLGLAAGRYLEEKAGMVRGVLIRNTGRKQAAVK